MSRLDEVFLDAAYAIALSAPGDPFHMKAEELAEQKEHVMVSNLWNICGIWKGIPIYQFWL